MYCFAYAPPPSMNLDASEEHLADGIYGFMHGNDPVPRFTVEQIYKALCHNPIVCTVTNIVPFLKQAFPLCPLIFGNEICGMISGFGYILSPVLDFVRYGLVQKYKTYAITALINKAGFLIDLLYDYFLHPENFHIKGHYGKLYFLDWRKADNSDDNIHTMKG